MAKLEIGEKYLTIKFVGHAPVSVFPNKDREGNQPHFKSDGVAVWVQKKQAPKVEEEKLIEDII